MIPPASQTVLVLLAILAALTIGLAWSCYRLLLDRGRLLLRLEAQAQQPVPSLVRGLPSGAYLSDFALAPLGAAPGEASVTLSDLADAPRLLIFLQEECLFSRALAHEFHRDVPTALELVTIVLGDYPQDSRSFYQSLPGVVLHDPHGQIARLYRVAATPAGYRLGAGRRTEGPQLLGPLALLHAAYGRTVADDASPPAYTVVPSQPPQEPLAVGAAVPAFSLPSNDGTVWSLATAGPRPLTLVFIDPDCPPCLAFLPQLAQRDPATLVIVSRGDAAEHRQLANAAGLRAPLLVQEQREVARAFHMVTTPAAYRIVEGVIVAGPAIGAAAVLALLDNP